MINTNMQKLSPPYSSKIALSRLTALQNHLCAVEQPLLLRLRSEHSIAADELQELIFENYVNKLKDTEEVLKNSRLYEAESEVEQTRD